MLWKDKLALHISNSSRARNVIVAVVFIVTVAVIGIVIIAVMDIVIVICIILVYSVVIIVTTCLVSSPRRSVI